MQKLLSKRGFDTGGVDGLIGPKTQDAIRAYQRIYEADPDARHAAHALERLMRHVERWDDLATLYRTELGLIEDEDTPPT